LADQGMQVVNGQYQIVELVVDWGLGEYGGVAGQATHGKWGVMQEEKGTERTAITYSRSSGDAHV
jgi:hypothetical protein